jgi:site-specific recombinase XerD
MEAKEREQFSQYLHKFTKKGSHKKLGKRTVEGILTMSKYIAKTKTSENVDNLQRIHRPFQEKHDHSMAKYALWMYLKFLGYDEKFLKDVVSFQRRSATALNDQEKLAHSVLTKKELTYLVEQIPKLRDKLIVKLLYDTGARVSELTNITIKDIDMQTREIQLMGKGRKPRTVFFQQSTKNMIDRHMQERSDQAPNSKLFGIKPITVWYHLKRYGREILQRDLRPHMLRHTRLQHMADGGVDSFLIKSYAGHSDIGTTQIYVKSSKYQRKMAFDKAGDIWEE